MRIEAGGSAHRQLGKLPCGRLTLVVATLDRELRDARAKGGEAYAFMRPPCTLSWVNCVQHPSLRALWGCVR